MTAADERDGFSGRFVREEDWPFGLRCMDCKAELRPGDAYSQRLVGLTDDVPVVEVICPACGLREAVVA
jgi:hypothetical protein